MKLKENLQENNIKQGEEMEILLDGKKVSENIKKDFFTRIEKIKSKKMPLIAVLAINGDEANLAYIKRIEKNCNKYGIILII